MKIYKLLQHLVVLVVLCSTNSIFAQYANEGNADSAQPIIFGPGSIREQYLNQYTDVFISSPNNGTVIQSVHEDTDQQTYFHSDKFFYYDQAIPNYVQLDSDLPSSNIMTPGVGYVLQTGGNGTRTESHRFSRKFNFSGGGSNDGVPHYVQVNSGKFCLLGNPYSGFLNLDTFLMNTSNKTKVRGPILLWSHNTVIAPDPSNSGMFIFTSNDYAMYNVLGGVAAGRSIGPSSENNYLGSTGIQTPNGTICMGTGFGVRAIATGVATFTPDMNGGNNGTAIQSFRPASATNTTNTIENEEKNTLLPPPPSEPRHRIWINMEEQPLTGSSPLRQLLIGYVACSSVPSNPYSECATAGETDRIFDAKTVPSINPRIEFYSFSNAPADPLNPLHLAIQGRSLASYTDSDYFKLGFKSQGGTYTLTTSNDGMFATKNYYILDASATDPLLRNPFPFTFSSGGVVENRLKVVFESPTNITNACGTQISSVWHNLFCTQIPNATGYRYRVRRADNSIVGVFNGGVNPWTFNINQVGVEFNTAYWVSVATYQVAGIGWAYGPECKITTPASPPQTTISYPACGNVITNTGDLIRANQMSTIFGIVPTQYRFNAVVGGINYVYTAPLATIADVNNRCTLRSNFRDLANNIMPVTINTTYVLSVDVLWNGNWIVGTTTCSFITGNVITRHSQSLSSQATLDVDASPNPFATNFKLDIATSSEGTVGVKIYDMVGRLIEERQVLINEINSQELGDAYPTGVYTIMISQDETVKTVRVIKR